MNEVKKKQETETETDRQTTRHTIQYSQDKDKDQRAVRPTRPKQQRGRDRDERTERKNQSESLLLKSGHRSGFIVSTFFFFFGVCVCVVSFSHDMNMYDMTHIQTRKGRIRNCTRPITEEECLAFFGRDAEHGHSGKNIHQAR